MCRKFIICNQSGCISASTPSQIRRASTRIGQSCRTVPSLAFHQERFSSDCCDASSSSKSRLIMEISGTRILGGTSIPSRRAASLLPTRTALRTGTGKFWNENVPCALWRSSLLFKASSARTKTQGDDQAATNPFKEASLLASGQSRIRRLSANSNESLPLARGLIKGS